MDRRKFIELTGIGMGGLMIALPGLYLVNLVERRIARIMHRLTLESASTGEAQ